MSWLTEQKLKFAKEADEVAKKKAEEDEICRRRHEDSINRLDTILNKYLGGIPGIDIVREEGSAYAEVNYKGKPLITFRVWQDEGENYDGDGCPHGNGRWYFQERMYFQRNHNDIVHKGIVRGPDGSSGRSINERELAAYLLEHVEQ